MSPFPVRSCSRLLQVQRDPPRPSAFWPPWKSPFTSQVRKSTLEIKSAWAPSARRPAEPTATTGGTLARGAARHRVLRGGVDPRDRGLALFGTSRVAAAEGSAHATVAKFALATARRNPAGLLDACNGMSSGECWHSSFSTLLVQGRSRQPARCAGVNPIPAIEWFQTGC